MESVILRISGSLVKVIGLPRPKMYDLVRVGEKGLVGEIIGIESDIVNVQVYEDTIGLRVGEPVISTNSPLMVELGPGLLGQVFDGVERPLYSLQLATGDFIGGGVTAPSLSREEKWDFVPQVKPGDELEPGTPIGIVLEKEFFEHRILLPPDVSGRVEAISAGKFSITEPILFLEDGKEITMLSHWPVRIPRPYKEKLPPCTAFLTGQRILDTLYPIALGGTAIVPGGFGTGKTVIEQTLAKYANTDIVVYVGCGERGNEMTAVLTEFPHLLDPKTKRPLINRSVFIANTSNMPVAAREASIYVGITIAEYFRDMGYSVALFADSTSRWAEALREISARLEEMPGEEGYPTYLSSRLASFYERSGRVRTLSGKEGSITVIGAVSPPGGDFTEPVTQSSMRVAGAFWALDTSLAHRRHFPAINWNLSYTLYWDQLKEWFTNNVDNEFPAFRSSLMNLLQKEGEIQKVAQMVGIDALPKEERLILEICGMVREVYLQQSAFHEIDAYCSPKRQSQLLRLLLAYYQYLLRRLDKGESLEVLLEDPEKEEITRLRELTDDEFEKKVADIYKVLQSSELSVEKGFEPIPL